MTINQGNNSGERSLNHLQGSAYSEQWGQNSTVQNDPTRDSSVTTQARSENKKKKTKNYPWYIEVPLLILVTLAIVAVLQTFVGRLYVIPSESMEPTLHGCSGCTGDRIYVNYLAYKFGSEPEPGDVIVFKGTPSWNEGYVSQRSSNSIVRAFENLGSYMGIVSEDKHTLVKRVIATGGQTVQCLEGDPGIMVNGKKVDDSYIQKPASIPSFTVGPQASEACQGAFFGPITVPEGHLWMMGDNRTNSADSRAHIGDEYQGTIPVDNVIGRVEAKVLPVSRIGRVESLDIQE